LVIKIAIDGAGVDDLLRADLISNFKEVAVHSGFDSREELFVDLIVAADGDALVFVIVVVIIMLKAHGDASDNGGGKVAGFAAPLFLGVAIDEFFVDFGAYEADGLFFEVFRVVYFEACKFCSYFFYGDFSPEFFEGIHIERETIKLSFIIDLGGIDVVVEGCELIDVIPDFFGVGVKDVGAVLVDVDAFDIFAMDIAA